MPMFEGPQAGRAVTMKVEPAEVLRLRARLQAVRDSVNDFVSDSREALRAAPFADDDVSQDAAADSATNADEAIEVTRQFIDQLEQTIAGLDQAVKTYNLTDDTQAIAMQQLNKDN